MRALIVVAALLLPSVAAAAQRFAVVAGNDVGGPGRPQLWFAQRDAERFGETLRELGEFDPDHIVSVRGSSAQAFRDALAGVEKHVAEARARGDGALLVVYFSGHAGPQGLEFGGDRLPFPELRALAMRSSADAKVVIVDACEAGALTQVKSARASPSVNFALPDAEVQGIAFIASTAVGEAAQESAHLGGSFFTHHLDVALRGAGDADGDGQVTLAEAFRYTAARTISATAATATGPQHPTYDFKMSGRGDVVLADLRRAESRLRLPADPGSVYVLKGPRGLLAEVPALQAPLSLALPSGEYRVERRGPDGRATGQIALGRGEDSALPRLVPSRYEVARSKGGPLATEWFGGFGVASLGRPGAGIAPATRAGFRREVGAFGLRVHLDYAFDAVREAGVRYTVSRVGGAAAGMLPVFGARNLLEAGLEVGGGWTTQALKDGRDFSAPDVTAGVAAVASRPLGRLRLALDVSAGGRLVRLNGQSSLEPHAVATVVILYGL